MLLFLVIKTKIVARKSESITPASQLIKFFFRRLDLEKIFPKYPEGIFHFQLEQNRHNSTWKQCLCFCCKQVITCRTRRHLLLSHVLNCLQQHILLSYSFLFMHWKKSQNSWIISVIGYFPINNFRTQSIKFFFSKFFFNIFWFLTKFAVTIAAKKTIIFLINIELFNKLN